MRGARHSTCSLVEPRLGIADVSDRATASTFESLKYLRSLGFAERHPIQVFEGDNELPIYLPRVLTCCLGLAERGEAVLEMKVRGRFTRLEELLREGGIANCRVQGRS